MATARVESFAAVWRLGDGPLATGSISLGDLRVCLKGRSWPGDRVSEDFRYGDLDDVRMGRNSDERLRGRPTLLLQTRGRPLLQLDVLGVGCLSEVFDQLSWAVAAARAHSPAAL